jgi:ABC-type polysaccharide/polyol phosphate export permease
LQESTFLVASIVVLMLGMVFASKGFLPGSVGYVLLNVVAAVVIVGSCGLFLVLLGFEVGTRRSLWCAVMFVAFPT